MVKKMKFGKQRPPRDDEESLMGSKGSLEDEQGRHGEWTLKTCYIQTYLNCLRISNSHSNDHIR